MKKSYYFIIFILLFFVITDPSFAIPKKGRSVKTYSDFKKLYSLLTEGDEEVSSLDSWEYVAGGIQKKYTKENAPEALYLLGKIYQTMWEKRSHLPSLSRSFYFYRKLIKKYRENSLSNDAIRELKTMSYSIELKGFKNILTLNPLTAYLLFFDKNLERGNFSILDVKDSLEGNKKNLAPVIVIDPGHGGEQLGAVGVGLQFEKDIVLDISKKAARLLREEIGAKVFLTRIDDVDIELIDRSGLANRLNADLFISIHANASISKKAHGIETYYLDNTRDKSSLRLAKFENEALKGFDSDLGFILSDIIQSAKQPNSISLAHHIQDSLINIMTSRYSKIKDLGVKKAPFHVLVGAHMPCVLVEVSFIDHKVEGVRLSKSEYRDYLAQGIVFGVKNYFLNKEEKRILKKEVFKK